MMGERSRMNGQRNQQWMNDFTRSTPGYDADSYSGHDAYIDSIHGTSTFAGNDSGYNQTIDGQYDYNYTDGMGQYYDTDNLSFNPGMMPYGGWQQVQPLQPQY